MCASLSPVRVDEGVERQPISPAGREVLHVHVAVARCLPLTPDQQSLLGRAVSLAALPRLRKQHNTKRKQGEQRGIRWGE